MAIWGEVELLCQAILDEGRKESEEIIAHAKMEADRIISKAESEAEKVVREQTLAAKKSVNLQARKIIDTSELEGKKSIIVFRERAVRELLDMLRSRLKGIRNHAAYPVFLFSAIREGVSALTGQRFIIELNPADVEHVSQNLHRISPDERLQFDIQASTQVEAGARIYTTDKRLLFDNTPSARLSRHENQLRREIWRNLFGTDEAQ